MILLIFRRYNCAGPQEEIRILADNVGLTLGQVTLSQFCIESFIIVGKTILGAKENLSKRLKHYACFVLFLII